MSLSERIARARQENEAISVPANISEVEQTAVRQIVTEVRQRLSEVPDRM